MSGVYGRISILDHLQDDSLSNKVMENLIENAITETVPKIGKATIGRSLQKIKAAEETEAAM
jgi:hypothetical protein